MKIEELINRRNQYEEAIQQNSMANLRLEGAIFAINDLIKLLEADQKNAAEQQTTQAVLPIEPQPSIQTTQVVQPVEPQSDPQTQTAEPVIANTQDEPEEKAAARKRHKKTVDQVE